MLGNFGSFAEPENRINIYYAASGRKFYTENLRFSGAMLPFEMLLSVKSGKIEVLYGGKSIVCSEGDVAIIPCDTPYTVFAKCDSVVTYVMFEARIYTVLRIFSLFDFPSVFVGDDKNTLFSSCEKIADMCGENDFTNTRLENAVRTVSLLYGIVADITEKSVTRKSFEREAGKLSAMSDVLLYIGNNISGNIMQETLSDIASLSPDAFYREFKNAIGDAPKDYIIAEKLRLARAMLVKTSLPIGEISKAVGYENQFYFSTLFRKKYGISPTEYKKSVSPVL